VAGRGLASHPGSGAGGLPACVGGWAAGGLTARYARGGTLRGL